MNPITAIGLAAAVLEFVNVGQKVLSHCVELYQSSERSLKEHVSLEILTTDLTHVNEKLRLNSVDNGDEALRKLCISCALTAEELLVALRKIQSTAKRSKRGCMKAALKGVWSKKHIEGLANRLADFRQQLTIHTTVDSWEQVMQQLRAQRDELATLDSQIQNLTQAIACLSDHAHSSHGSQMVIVQERDRTQISSVEDENERGRCRIIEAITQSPMESRQCLERLADLLQSSPKHFETDTLKDTLIQASKTSDDIENIQSVVETAAESEREILVAAPQKNTTGDSGDARLSQRYEIEPSVFVRAVGFRSTSHYAAHVSRQCYQSPKAFNAILGAFCIRLLSSGRTLRLLEIRYTFPQWLAAQDLFIVAQSLAYGQPTIGLKIQRRVPWGEADSVLRFALVGNLQGVKDILHSGKASLDDVDPNHGRTALHYAVQKNHIEVCRFLLQAGADPEVPDRSNTSASERAWEHILTHRGTPCEIDALRRLFTQHDEDSWSFSHLHKVVLGIRPLNLKTELDLSRNLATLDSRDVRGRTPLYWAATRGDISAVEALLSTGADLSVADDSNGTALTSAASSGNSRILEALIQRAANVKSANSRGDIALHYACRHQNKLGPVKLLLEAGSEIDFRNKVGNTPLTGAAIMNNVKIGEHLILSGADRHNRGVYGDTPLFEAIFHNSHDFLRLLLSKGARYTELNHAGCTVLHAAALEADVTTVEILTSSRLGRLDPSQRNNNGETALDMLTKRLSKPAGFEEVFANLLRAVTMNTGNRKEKIE